VHYPATADEILREAVQLAGPGQLSRYPDSIGVIFTGGEPALQLDSALVHDFSRAGFFTAIETNGTIALHPDLGLDWICVSPKVPDDAVKQRRANEAKYVVVAGDPLPTCTWPTQHRLLSPAFLEDGTLPKPNLDHAIQLVKENPRWRLSIQQHKGWGVR
jgi:organic radical activating enzyme